MLRTDRSARWSSRKRARRRRALFIERTRTALEELIGRRLDDVRLAVMMLDGMEIADRCHVGRAWDLDRRGEAPTRAVGRQHRERHARA